MIKAIRLFNFFSFRGETTINLHPELNVLVGMNGSGKSNLLKALQLLKAVASGELDKLINKEWGGYNSMAFYGASRPEIPIEIQFLFDSKAFDLRHDYSQDEIDLTNTFPLEAFATPNVSASSFFPTLLYRIIIFPVGETRYSIVESFYLKAARPLKSDDIDEQPADEFTTNERDIEYFNFKSGVGFIDSLVRNREHAPKREMEAISEHESAFGEINSARYGLLNRIRNTLKTLAIYEAFDTRPKSQMRLPIETEGYTRLASDGGNLAQVLNHIKNNSRSSFAKIREGLQEINPAYKAIEFSFFANRIQLMLEEAGLEKAISAYHLSDGTLRYLCLLAICHNPSIGKVVAIDEPEVFLHPDMIYGLQKLFRDASKKTQFILTTHSAHFLDYFDFEHIRVVEKDEHNRTVVAQYSKENFKGWYEEFAIGKMWRAGDLGGNRW
ncbi:MAG: AAA family ATPase [Chloroherpetonaceae bacterium]